MAGSNLYSSHPLCTGDGARQNSHLALATKIYQEPSPQLGTKAFWPPVWAFLCTKR